MSPLVLPLILVLLQGPVVPAAAPVTAPPPASAAATAPAPVVAAPISAHAETEPTACDAEAWPAPLLGVPPLSVRVLATDGAGSAPFFELLLSAPPASAHVGLAAQQPFPAPGPRPVSSGSPSPSPVQKGPAVAATACLWLDPAAGFTQQTGVISSGEALASAPARPPQGARFHPLTVMACPKSSGTQACLRLVGVPPLDDAPGRVPALLRLPGRAEPLAVVMHRTPDGRVLVVCMLAGLIGSFLVTLWGPKLEGLRNRRRRLRQLEARRGATEEDFVPLLNRVDALLGMCRGRLEGWKAPAGVLFFDESLLDDRLAEAGQLLTLSEEKTRCWQRSQVSDLPPSVETEIADLLRRFDAEVFLLSLPVAASADPATWYPLPLKDALARLKDAGLGFHKNLATAVDAALSAPATVAPKNEEARKHWEDVERVRQLEIAALQEWKARGGEFFQAAAPRAVRAIDARVNVCRAARQYQLRLTEENQPPDLQRVRAVQRGLDDWARQDLYGPISGRPDIAALRALRWSGDNARDLLSLRGLIEDNLSSTATPPPATPPAPTAAARAERTLPLLECRGPRRWRAYEPVTIELHLLDALARSYVWRQNVRIRWRAESNDLRVLEALQFGGIEVITPPGRDGQGKRSFAGVFECGSARMTGYATGCGDFHIRPVSVAFRDPLTCKYGDAVLVPDEALAELSVRVRRNPEASLFAGVGVAHVLRLSFTGLLSMITGLVFVDGLFSNAQGWAVYAQAFAWAFGIDLATAAVRGGWVKLQAALPAFQRTTNPSPS